MAHTHAEDLPQNECLSNRSDSASSLQGTLGHVWRPFWLSQLREGADCHPVCGSKGCCQLSHNVRAVLRNQEVPSPQCQQLEKAYSKLRRHALSLLSNFKKLIKRITYCSCSLHAILISILLSFLSLTLLLTLYLYIY